MSHKCHLMSTYCVCGTGWGLSFLCSNLTALMHQGWLTLHPVHCGSEKSAMCSDHPARPGQGWDWTPGRGFPVLSSCFPQVDTSSELWVPHLQGSVLSHLELRVLLITCPQHSRDVRWEFDVW